MKVTVSCLKGRSGRSYGSYIVCGRKWSRTYITWGILVVRRLRMAEATDPCLLVTVGGESFTSSFQRKETATDRDV